MGLTPRDSSRSCPQAGSCVASGPSPRAPQLDPMPTPSARCIEMLVLAVLLLVGCSAGSDSSGDLDPRTGRSSVVAERRNVGAQVVLDVHAVDCRDPNGAPLAQDLAACWVAQTAWQSLALPVDAVHVTRLRHGCVTPRRLVVDPHQRRAGCPLRSRSVRHRMADVREVRRVDLRSAFRWPPRRWLADVSPGAMPTPRGPGRGVPRR